MQVQYRTRTDITILYLCEGNYLEVFRNGTCSTAEPQSVPFVWYAIQVLIANPAIKIQMNIRSLPSSVKAASRARIAYAASAAMSRSGTLEINLQPHLDEAWK